MPETRNVREAWDRTPPMTPQSRNDTERKSELDEFEARLLRIREHEAMLRAMGKSNDEPRDNGPALKMNVDFGQVLTSAHKEAGEAHALVAKIIADNAKLSTELAKERMEMYERQLAKLEERLTPEKGNTVLTQVQALKEFNGLVREMMQEAGAGQPVVQDNATVIKLKELEISHTTRLEEMQAAREENNRKFEFEMEKWRTEREEAKQKHEKEMALRERELELQRRGQEKNREAVMDFVGALSKAVDERMVEGEPAIAQTEHTHTEVTEEPKMTPFECVTCKNKMEVPANLDHFSCPKCKMEYVDEAFKGKK